MFGTQVGVTLIQMLIFSMNSSNFVWKMSKEEKNLCSLQSIVKYLDGIINLMKSLVNFKNGRITKVNALGLKKMLNLPILKSKTTTFANEVVNVVHDKRNMPLIVMWNEIHGHASIVLVAKMGGFVVDASNPEVHQGRETIVENIFFDVNLG